MARKATGLIVIICIAFIVQASAQIPDEKPVAIPAGTSLRVKLGTLLSDKTNKAGDPFTAELADPIIVDGRQAVPAHSTLQGHIAFILPSGRFTRKAEMRLVVDKLTTPDEVVYPLSSTLQEAHDVNCENSTVGSKANGKPSEEGTITGCGKSVKSAAKDAAILGGVGAMGGLTVGELSRGGCDYYGNCYPSSGPGIGADVGIGAGVGAGTALVYHLLQHEKHIILIYGTPLTFVVSRTTSADAIPVTPVSEDATPAK
ncbi:MAG TPA: hypothetical protein VKV95_05920 [Terriglobia bacterium]|nr:hypothetical protein [Terriglobia bacterium]